MPYTVFIPTAGTGSRLGGLTRYLNKALVSIENKPTLSRIMEMFPEDTEYIIAVGYKGELVKEFVSLAYAEKKIRLVDVYPYEGEGSGLGYTINCCREYLQKPFIFCSCDTLVNETIPGPDYNWMGWDIRDNKEQYRTISINSQDKIETINEKGENLESDPKPYIGLAGIHDYLIFWEGMEKNPDMLLQGESVGLREILARAEIRPQKFTWFDTGVTVELQATRQRFHIEGGPNILEKENEAIWFLDKKVIKFSDDTEFIKDRVKRAGLLKGFVPSIVGNTDHMYAYEYVQGDVMSHCVSLPVFRQLLNTTKMFWKAAVLSEGEKNEFYDSCMKFYKDKTYSRVKEFFERFGKMDEPTIINHKWYPSVNEMLREVDWDYVANGLPGRFHGDFHFENILYNEKEGNFEFLDWRQNFGSSLTVGDIYYDFGKMLHGLIMCHELVAKEEYSVRWDENEITYDFERKQILVKCENYYYKWLEKNGYDVAKVKLMAALIFLNIAGLHHYPYSFVLMALGKEMLAECLEE